MRCFYVVAIVISMQSALATAALLDAKEMQALAGKWQIRIDGGGEIYSARFNFKAKNDDSLTGSFLSSGKKAAIRRIVREDGLYVVRFKSRRGGLPVQVMFAFDLVDNRMVGDVDFDSGTSMRSYEFEATRITAENAKAGSKQQTKAEYQASSDNQPADAKSVTPIAVKPISSKPTRRQLAFQQGENGYQGTLDTEIWSIAPSKPLYRQGTLTTDGNNGGGESQVLMRFAEVIGGEENQLPKHSRVISAKLIVVAFDPGSTIYLHRMLVAWDNSATWDSVARGISVDNVEASTVRDGFNFGEINMDKQSIEFDVTATVQKWANGEPNYGWVFHEHGQQRLGFLLVRLDRARLASAS